MLLVKQFCVEIGACLVCCVEVGAVNNILMKEALCMNNLRLFAMQCTVQSW